MAVVEEACEEQGKLHAHEHGVMEVSCESTLLTSTISGPNKRKLDEEADLTSCNSISNKERKLSAVAAPSHKMWSDVCSVSYQSLINGPCWNSSGTSIGFLFALETAQQQQLEEQDQELFAKLLALLLGRLNSSSITSESGFRLSSTLSMLFFSKLLKNLSKSNLRTLRARNGEAGGGEGGSRSNGWVDLLFAIFNLTSLYSLPFCATFFFLKKSLNQEQLEAKDFLLANDLIDLRKSKSDEDWFYDISQRLLSVAFEAKTITRQELWLILTAPRDESMSRLNTNEVALKNALAELLTTDLDYRYSFFSGVHWNSFLEGLSPVLTSRESAIQVMRLDPVMRALMPLFSFKTIQDKNAFRNFSAVYDALVKTNDVSFTDTFIRWCTELAQKLSTEKPITKSARECFVDFMKMVRNALGAETYAWGNLRDSTLKILKKKSELVSELKIAFLRGI